MPLYRQNLFVIAGFVSTYFAVIFPGFQMFFVIAGFVIAGFHCICVEKSVTKLRQLVYRTGKFVSK